MSTICLRRNGTAQAGVLKNPKRVGADGFIRKPYRIRQVTITIREMLDGREKKGS